MCINTEFVIGQEDNTSTRIRVAHFHPFFDDVVLAFGLLFGKTYSLYCLYNGLRITREDWALRGINFYDTIVYSEGIQCAEGVFDSAY